MTDFRSPPRWLSCHLQKEHSPEKKKGWLNHCLMGCIIPDRPADVYREKRLKCSLPLREFPDMPLLLLRPQRLRDGGQGLWPPHVPREHNVR